MGKESRYIHQAIAALAKAQASMSERLDRHERIMDSQAREIVQLQSQVLDIRNAAIRSDLHAGLPGYEVASKYGLSQARISQIKRSSDAFLPEIKEKFS